MLNDFLFMIECIYFMFFLVVTNIIFAGKIFNILASYGVCVLGKGGR